MHTADLLYCLTEASVSAYTLDFKKQLYILVALLQLTPFDRVYVAGLRVSA
jgi:hypothetical protein